ncbi:MAG TPA: bifunctional UDP-N-acetylmuramoyl-tripeptide:D-alanyl-D-alanine ligase/alanine racemase, partial [Porphyromonadaceae bacterium]|nr:bifunctional UDP-N-acetylmuramoyl-tripeptide:D-alanyl-D-alanine ligase/alanine racemase [Porphyromonadaceae bacterium]
MTYSITEIASILGVSDKNIIPSEISILLVDSRKLSDPEKSLFFALESKNNDAHQFITDLYQSGVRNFVVSKKWKEWAPFSDANFFQVKNPLSALQKIAAHHRRKFDIPVIGITGSNGKTVVKEWLYQLLQDDYNIVRSPRSYNSQIGVPLSVWQLNEQTQIGIFEAGISQPDEMEHLEPVIRPTMGILTNIGKAHQENFESIQQKCMEKLELFTNCEMFVYEEDDKMIDECVNLSVLSQKSFAWSSDNTDAPLYIFKIEKNQFQSIIHYSFLHFNHAFAIPFTDQASIENAIDCLAVMLYLHVSPETISERMKKLEPVAMRLDVRRGKKDCLIINDTYNSDINSIEIALDFQQQRK